MLLKKDHPHCTFPTCYYKYKMHFIRIVCLQKAQIDTCLYKVNFRLSKSYCRCKISEFALTQACFPHPGRLADSKWKRSCSFLTLKSSVDLVSTSACTFFLCTYDHVFICFHTSNSLAN